MPPPVRVLLLELRARWHIARIARHRARLRDIVTRLRQEQP